MNPECTHPRQITEAEYDQETMNRSNDFGDGFDRCMTVFGLSVKPDPLTPVERLAADMVSVLGVHYAAALPTAEELAERGWVRIEADQ